MGIFDSIKKHNEKVRAEKLEKQKAAEKLWEEKKAAEEAQKQKIAASPFVSALFNAFETNGWILHRQSSLDKGIRELRITKDTVEVKWSEWRSKQVVVGQDKYGFDKYKTQYYEEIFQQAIYSFTQNGYAPLDDLTKQRLFAEVITEHIEHLVPGTYSKDTYRAGDLYSQYREYTLPMSTKALF